MLRTREWFYIDYAIVEHSLCFVEAMKSVMDLYTFEEFFPHLLMIVVYKIVVDGSRRAEFFKVKGLLKPEIELITGSGSSGLYNTNDGYLFALIDYKVKVNV